MHEADALLARPGFAAALARSVAQGAPPPLLADAKVKLTSRCNLRCRMCDYWRTVTETALPTPLWKRILDQMAALGATKVHFSGGEVFLRRDFLGLVEHAVAAGLKTNLTTNATLVDRARARRLVEAGVNSVSVSLDGPTARVHDAVRGQEGAFRRSLRALGWIRRYCAGARRPPRLRVNFVVQRANFRRVPEMVELAAALGAVDLLPMPVDEKGRRKNRLSRVQIEEYNREVAPRVLEARRAAGFPLLPERVYPFGVTPEEVAASREGRYARGAFERQACLAPWLHTFLDWKGDVFLCCMTNGRIEPLGNAARTPLHDIFHGERYRRVRADFAALRHFPDCGRCDLFLRENARLHAAMAAAHGDPVA